MPLVSFLLCLLTGGGYTGTCRVLATQAMSRMAHQETRMTFQWLFWSPVQNSPVFWLREPIDFKRQWWAQWAQLKMLCGVFAFSFKRPLNKNHDLQDWHKPACTVSPGLPWLRLDHWLQAVPPANVFFAVSIAIVANCLNSDLIAKWPDEIRMG